jgi:PAS domain S-box-containing protein
VDEKHDIDDLTLWLEVLQRVADASTNMVVITDPERRILWVNATYVRITGWALAECIGKRPRELLHGPDTSREVLDRMADQLRNGEPVQDVELVNYRRSGEAYRVRLNIEAVRDGGGQTIAYLSMQSDITDQHQLALDSQELKRRLDVAQRLARLGRIEVDPVSGRSQWSSEVFRILGEVPDEAPRDFLDLLQHVPETDRAALLATINAACASDEVDVELKVQGRRGVRWLRCIGVPPSPAQPGALPVSWSVQDVTPYKSSLEQKRVLNDRLNRLVQERTRSLEESNQALEDFSYALSHDLRTPLRHVAGYAEVMADALRAGRWEECMRYCDKVGQAAQKMQALIEGMLAFARAGRQGLRIETVDVAAMVSELVTVVDSAGPASAVVWDIDPDLPQIEGDPVLLREVWLNLMDNAVKYSSRCEQSHIRIAWSCQDEGWSFTIRDNGAGFDPQHAHKLFGMFQRLHREDQFTGTGVGLALVHRIIESHGGRIWAESSPGEGASFHFCLPFRVEQTPTAISTADPAA